MTNTTAIGRAAEDFVAERLVALGARIIARNERTRFYEIDIIALKNNRLHFVEVKYRRQTDSGDGVAAITNTKLQRLIKAAQVWQATHPVYTDYEASLDIAAVTAVDNSDIFKLKYLANITAY